MKRSSTGLDFVTPTSPQDQSSSAGPGVIQDFFAKQFDIEEHVARVVFGLIGIASFLLGLIIAANGSGLIGLMLVAISLLSINIYATIGQRGVLRQCAKMIMDRQK